MKFARLLSGVMAVTVAACSIGSISAMAGEHAISIDMTDYNDAAWANIAMTNDDTVETGVNIRSAASTEASVSGFLYRGGAVYVLDRGEEWTYVQSGKVTGYIKNEYLTYGAEAKGLAEYYGTYGVKASWNDVNIFAGESGNAQILHSADDGETFRLVNKNGGWMEITTGSNGKAFVPAEDVSMVMVLDGAIAVGEEDEGEQSVFTELDAPAVSTPAVSEAAENTVTVAAAQEEYTEDTSYAEPAYSETSYTEPAYTEPAYTEPAYTEPAYEEPVYEEPAEETYQDTSYEDTSYTEATVTYTEPDTSGSASELSARAASMYEDYLTAQAAADAAVANGEGEQRIKDTAAAATAAYAAFLKVQNAADAAAYGLAYEEPAQTTAEQTVSYTETADTTHYDDVSYDDNSYDESYDDNSYDETVSYEDTSSSDSGASSSQASSSDLELLAALIYCEAGNQPYEGQVAVGAVVMNRVYSSSFPNSISEVINQAGQFTPSYTGVLAAALANGSGAGYIGAASDAMAGSDPTGGALYFNVHQGYGTKFGDHWFF